MAEIKQVAYQDLRNYIEANWKYIGLGNTSEVLRLSTDDSRVSWIHSPNSAELQLKIVLKGNDSEVSLPTTISNSSIYNVASGEESFSTEILDSSFTFESENDELTVIHSIQVPQIV